MAELDSSSTQMIYALGVRSLGLRPKSRVCAENLAVCEGLIGEEDYDLLCDIRELRNKAMYDALFREDLNKESIHEYIDAFEELFLRLKEK